MSKLPKVIYEWDSNVNQVYNGRVPVTSPVVFQSTHPFMQYQMHFLENPIVMQLRNFLILGKTKFNYKISAMSETDKDMVNQVFQYINPSLKLSGRDLYLNGKSALSDEKESIEVDGYKFKASVLIQGYKENDKKQISPIWKLHTVCDGVKV